MYAFGREGTQTIILKLNEAGQRKRSGKKWDKHFVLRIIRNPLYVGKLRWREAVYEANHEGIISEELFAQAQEILRERNDELRGRLWHNGDERLLSGVIKCVRCGKHMIGISTTKSGRKFPYYVCNTRWKTHDCTQDYVRADLLEEAVMKDVKAMFLDEQFMGRVWEEANRRLGVEKPDVEKEIAKVDAQIGRTRAAADRYFKAFESGAMKPELCNGKIEDLNMRLVELEAEKADLEARRKRLDLPALDRETLAKMVAEFEEVMAAGTNPQKKHLLQRVVKKVLVHDRRTVEVWYGLPNPPSVRTPECLAPRKQPLSELPHVPSRPSASPSDPWPSMQDVWYDHRSQIVVARKTLSVPTPFRAAKSS
jgi:site-specific DNA recombinase